MVPENGELAIRIVRARDVDVWRAAVAQLQIGLRQHPPSLKDATLLYAPKVQRIYLPRTRVNRLPTEQHVIVHTRTSGWR